MSKCLGCGVVLQNSDSSCLGYVKDISKNLCERCFRIENYGEYKKVFKDNIDYVNILKKINNTDDLVVLVLDIFNFEDNIDIIKRNISNDILLVLTKRDILPKRVNDDKLLEYVNDYNLNVVDTVIISSYKNYNFDYLYELINKYKKSKNVYVVGFTNAGKSTMINKIIYNYSDCGLKITTSIMPSTTLDMIDIKLNDDLVLIDTPGLLYQGSFYNNLSSKDLKKIIPKCEIKPISYQIKGKQYIVIDKYAIIELENINVVIFMSNSLNIKRLYKMPETCLVGRNINVNNNDLVISALGFIKCIGRCNLKVYTYDDISITTRKYLI